MDTLSPAQALLDDALSQRLAGNWRDAVALAERAFELGWRAGDVDQVMEAVLASGHAHREMGELSAAAEAYGLAHTVAALNGRECMAGRALNGLGIVLQQRGEMDGAEGAYREARGLALRMGDSLTIGNIEMNLGTLQTVRGRFESAHEFYVGCLRRYESISHDRGVLGVLNNMGMLYIDGGRLAEAAECLARALEVSRRTADVISEGTIRLNLAELYIVERKLEEARAHCDEAYEIFSRCGEESGRSEALKHYGVIFREKGKLYLAEGHLNAAIRIAVEKSYPLQEAESQRELALVLRQFGRNRDALTALNRAHGLFSLLQARQDKADIRERLKKLEDDFLALVSFWSESIDEIDGYTRGHCQRVADYACAIAERVGFRQEDLVWFRMGALLHDVGKTAIPAEILNKPSDLLPHERALMEQHTVLGEQLLSDVEFPWDIRPMIRSHHERWDGSGYPDGIAGEAIPLSARILHIADVFDALTTTRSYRLRVDPAVALEQMEEDRGSFDPSILKELELALHSRLNQSLVDSVDLVIP